MTSLYELSERLDVGDKIAWTGEQHMGGVEQTYPRTVTDKEHNEDEIRVDAEGINGGKYYYTVKSRGDSESVYVNQGKERGEGSVAFAELTESDERLLVKRGYHDSR